MPYSFILDSIPAGYVAQATRAGEQASVIVAEFVSSQDGDLFIQRLEGLPNDLLRRVQDRLILPSSVDHMLAVIGIDRSVTLFVNELAIVGSTLIRKPVEIGQLLTNDDIADIERIRFQGVSVPPESGFLFLFSTGWRKGLYYDFRPLQQDALPRDYDLEAALGQAYCYLMFEQAFRISEDDWDRLFSQKWFPFISLSESTTKLMLSHVRNGWSVDEILARVVADLKPRCPAMLKEWPSNPLIGDRMPLIEKAIERYLDSDYISCSYVLYPEIEGLLRSFHEKVRAASKPTSATLVSTAIPQADPGIEVVSRLLPVRFRQYLTDVYFRGFQPTGDKPLSRHTVAHGVAKAESFDLKAATIGLLIYEQLLFTLPAQQAAAQPADSVLFAWPDGSDRQLRTTGMDL